MSFTIVPSVVTGQQYTASEHNTYARNSLLSLWVYTTVGDLVYASDSTNIARLANVANNILIGGASAPQWLAVGSAGQYVGVTAGAPAWKSDGVPGIFTTVGDLVYGSSAGAASRLAKPSSLNFLSEASNGTPAWRALKISALIQVVAPTTDVSMDSSARFYVPSICNGSNVSASGWVVTAGVGYPNNVQIHNLTKYPNNTLFPPGSGIEIGSGQTKQTTFYSVDSSYDDVSTNDVIDIYMVSLSNTTAPKGLWVELVFTLV